MRKTYMMLLALVLTMLGASEAMAQKIYRAELDKSMFKAWTTDQPGASEVEEPEAIDNGAATFNCESNLYKQLEGGNVVFGNTNVYYLWYADLTGTQTISFKGTAGLVLRVLMNRPVPVEGGDAHGGTTVERQVTIDDNGEGSLDVSDLQYVHLNCIKVNWGGSGIVKEMMITGTVKPVTGLLSLINNGDAEGDDLSSFPVSLDGPNNDNSAPDKPQIVAGEGVNGSKCFKVTAFDNPTEVWHTQFYVKADEVMPKGSKWQLKMSVKADQNTMISSSAQAQPRTWKGDMGLGNFDVTTEWQDFSWSGEIGVDDFQSIAFDLSNENGTAGNAGVSFYFDNIEFGYDLGGSNPMSAISLAAGYDVVRVDFGGLTNMKDLVKAATTKTLIFDKSAVSLTVDGESFDANIVSVEGYDDGNLYIFIGEDLYDDNVVKVAFKNPEDAAHRLLFTTGKWEGQAVPDFSGIDAPFDAVLAEAGYVSYMYGEPEMEGISPEQGSFNLPVDTKEFVVTFNQPVLVSSVVAKLDSEALAASAADGDDEYSKVIKLTRTSDAELRGAKDLVISAAIGKAGKDFGLTNDIVVKYSFGPIDTENAEEIEVLIDAALFQSCANDQIPVGYYVRYQNTEDRVNGTGYSGGARVFEFAAGGDFTKGLYLREGYLLYGNQEGYSLTLAAGKKYTIHFNSAMWKSSGKWMKFDIFTKDAYDAEGEPLYTQMIENTPDMNGQKTAVSGSTDTNISFTPETAGDYILRWTATDDQGVQAYSEILIGNVSMKYIPDLRGLEETLALKQALSDAKAARDANNDERYSGEDFTALDNLITEVETNMGSYSAPSVYAAKTAELAAAAKTLADHKAACDSYDENIKKAVDHVANNAENKFKETQVNKDMEALVAKYHASKVVNNIAEDGEDPVYETVYTFDVLKDNDALAAANAELSKAVSVASQYFTEVALTSNIQQGNSGVAVLVERNRLGARALMSLGVEETDPLIEAVKNSVTDDDMLAENIKGRIKTELYSKLKDADNDVFGPQVDEFGDPVTDGNGEIVSKSYDMTVFIKNPNFYAVDGTQGCSEENVPGWTYPAGYGKPGLFTAWSARNVAGLPEDCAFTTYWGTCRMEQTIEDLPAGVYVVSLCGSDWSNRAGLDPEGNDKPYDVSGFVYCKTSDTAPVIEGEEEDRDINFAATRTIVYGGQYNMDHSINLGYAEVVNDETGFISTEDGEFFGIPVTDGKLTLGIHFGGDAQYFFQHARLTLVGAADFDYANAVETSIENAAAPKVRGIQVYDLNGRRMIKANKGLQIVKKQMSDGSVRVEKVVVK